MPNPFHSATSIRYALPEDAYVTLKVFNLQGQEIGSLVEGSQTAGPHIADWRPGKLPAGVYFYRLEAAGQVKSRKLIRLE
jgi:hypothetical protein